MTREEIIDFCEMKSQLEPENKDIFNYVIKSLEAWDKVVEEIDDPYRKGAIISVDSVVCIIKKHLAEVEE